MFRCCAAPHRLDGMTKKTAVAKSGAHQRKDISTCISRSYTTAMAKCGAYQRRDISTVVSCDLQHVL